LRMQQKLVPFNPPPSSSRTVVRQEECLLVFMILIPLCMRVHTYTHMHARTHTHTHTHAHKDVKIRQDKNKVLIFVSYRLYSSRKSYSLPSTVELELYKQYAIKDPAVLKCKWPLHEV